MTRFMADDVVGVDAPEMPDAAVFHGRAAVRERLAGFRELFTALELRSLTIEELGERVFVLIKVHGQSPSTALPVDFDIAYVLDVRDGLATTIRSFLTEAQAREYAATH